MILWHMVNAMKPKMILDGLVLDDAPFLAYFSIGNVKETTKELNKL